MIGYITLGTNDFPKAAAFYDALLSALGATRQMDMDGFIAWSTAYTNPWLGIIRPYNGEAATVGNGNMVALHVREKKLVDALHAKALELGGSDEGAPGQRFEGFYAAYFRDPEGHKLNVFCTE